MDKKVLAAIIDGIVAKVATEAGLDEGEARAMVGIALKKNSDNFVKAIADKAAALAGTLS